QGNCPWPSRKEQSPKAKPQGAAARVQAERGGTRPLRRPPEGSGSRPPVGAAAPTCGVGLPRAEVVDDTVQRCHLRRCDDSDR
ncbi:hypothetical protein GW17_00049259, partial [Ensete ventricosum]